MKSITLEKMFILLILFSFLFRYCLMIRNNSNGICQKVNLCRKNQLCHPIVLKCQNGSCRYRRFNMNNNNNQYLIYSRWFYDSYEQRCRRYNNHIENFVYFRFLRDCKRLCPIVQQKRNDQIVTLHISDSLLNYNDTIYVQLYIDNSPNWIQTLTDWMNITTNIYNSQIHYFQNYRRHFTNFIDPIYQLMFRPQR